MSPGTYEMTPILPADLGYGPRQGFTVKVTAHVPPFLPGDWLCRNDREAWDYIVDDVNRVRERRRYARTIQVRP